MGHIKRLQAFCLVFFLHDSLISTLDRKFLDEVLENKNSVVGSARNLNVINQRELIKNSLK